MTNSRRASAWTAPLRTGWQRLVADPAHGPLPLLLLGLTALTGIVDAVSILALGRVFVANMTGNVVFIGFAVAGAAGFSLAASLLALGGFLAGASIGGRLNGRLSADRAQLISTAVTIELALVGAATVLVAAPMAGGHYAAVAVLAIGTGIQNAVVRRLAVPDLTTTVLTMTLTGIAADIRAGTHGTGLNRRVLAVAIMLGGAVGGGELVRQANAAAALALATALLGAIALAARHTTGRPGSWRAGDDRQDARQAMSPNVPPNHRADRARSLVNQRSAS